MMGLVKCFTVSPFLDMIALYRFPCLRNHADTGKVSGQTHRSAPTGYGFADVFPVLQASKPLENLLELAACSNFHAGARQKIGRLFLLGMPLTRKTINGFGTWALALDESGLFPDSGRKSDLKDILISNKIMNLKREVYSEHTEKNPGG